MTIKGFDTMQNFKGHLIQKKKFLKIFSVGLGLTLAQFFIFKFIVFQEDNSLSSFLITKERIKQGDVITIDNVEAVPLNDARAQTTLIPAWQLKNAIGRRVDHDLEIGSPLLKKMIASDYAEKSPEELIPPGRRLFFLDADLGDSASLLKINEKIDLIAHMDIPQFGQATETILDGVSIVSINENHSLGFYLTPEEIKIITFMKSYSQFSVAIRNPNDHTKNENAAVTFNQFLQNPKIQNILSNDSFKIIQGSTKK